ncbi:uncharacterized protein T551_00935 [Pneumocystis jirovecii RU7]|uniref:Casein kinase substrate phosphoprotein PP28 domain-containing protein n=1 Tax=Pneumocystis jirovecii (strain RU7) TaxID=1408657 RepID=A0A0W4ZTH4_PNEJ7|nr:uncharacterized protein T551_00935 [Pneumocystis jirovecii RU7]KTW31674.1 hypothetical protein T551_00935 [Pneumocystis jirovecii RU7]
MTKKKFRKPIRGEGKSFSANLVLDEEGTLVPGSASKTWKEAKESSSSSDTDNNFEESDTTDSEVPSFHSTRKKEKTNALESIIEIENPNRVKKQNLKISDLSKMYPQELSRREREAIEKKAAEERYRKLHSEGKTEKAKADLARLAIVRKEREEKARQRKAEQEAKENAMRNRTDK